MNEKTDVLLYGLGAIGSFYAFILSRSPAVRLTVVARSNYDAVKNNVRVDVLHPTTNCQKRLPKANEYDEQGLTINSEVHGSHNFRPHNVVKTPADAPGHYDYIVCAHKAIDQDSVPERLAPIVDKNTTIVIIQNGVGNEEPFRTVFPHNTILTCVTWVGAMQVQSGIIKHTKSEHTQIGLYPNDPDYPALLDQDEKNLEKFTALLRTGNTPFDVEKNMQVQRWEKVVWNAAWNSVTTMTMLDTQSWLKSSPEAMPLTRQLMREVIDVARKCGVPIRYELIDELIEKILGMPPIYSSMHADAMAGRPIEVEVILGTPVRRARELGMSVPTLETFYGLLAGVNYRLMQSSS